MHAEKKNWQQAEVPVTLFAVANVGDTCIIQLTKLISLSVLWEMSLIMYEY